MPSKLLGTAELDFAALEPDLTFLRDLPRLAEAYDEFSSGGYRNHSLWNATGRASDSRYQANSAGAQRTDFGAAVPRLEERLSDQGTVIALEQKCTQLLGKPVAVFKAERVNEAAAIIADVASQSLMARARVAVS